jgi:hypothetical protein
MNQKGQKGCDWDIVCEAADQGFRDGTNTLACIEMLERGNSEDVIKKVERTPDALLACTLIRDALLDRLLITVVRAYGPIHKGDFHLRVAFKELDRREPDDELPNDVDGTALSDAIALWKEVGTDRRLGRLEHFRNKVVAHQSRRNPDISAPLIKDLFGFGRHTCKIWERLSFAAGSRKLQFEVQNRAYQESANAFWSIWLGK